MLYVLGLTGEKNVIVGSFPRQPGSLRHNFVYSVCNDKTSLDFNFV